MVVASGDSSVREAARALKRATPDIASQRTARRLRNGYRLQRLSGVGVEGWCYKQARRSSWKRVLRGINFVAVGEGTR